MYLLIIIFDYILLINRYFISSHYICHWQHNVVNILTHLNSLLWENLCLVEFKLEILILIVCYKLLSATVYMRYY